MLFYHMEVEAKVNHEVLRGWLLCCTPFWITSACQIFLRAGSFDAFYYQYGILAGVVILIFSVWFSIRMRLEEPRGSLIGDILVGVIVTSVISTAFTSFALISTVIANILLGYQGGLSIGSPLLGSSEEVVYFLYVAGVPMGSIVLLAMNIAFVHR